MMLAAFFSWMERRKIQVEEETKKRMLILSERKTYSQIEKAHTGLPLTGISFKKRFSTDAAPYYFASDDMDEIAACAWGQLYKQAMQYLEENGCKYYRMVPHYRMSGYYEGKNTVWLDVEGVRV